MEVFNVYWNRHDNLKKYNIGYLIKSDKWIYKYDSKILEVIELGFRPFPEFPNIYEEYVSDELFKTFSDRLSDISYLRNTDSKLITDNIKIMRKVK